MHAAGRGRRSAGALDGPTAGTGHATSAPGALAARPEGSHPARLPANHAARHGAGHVRCGLPRLQAGTTVPEPIAECLHADFPLARELHRGHRDAAGICQRCVGSRAVQRSVARIPPVRHLRAVVSLHACTIVTQAYMYKRVKQVWTVRVGARYLA